MIIKAEVKALSPVHYVEDIERIKLSMVVFSDQLDCLIGGNIYEVDSKKYRKELEEVKIGDLVELEVRETKGGNTFRILSKLKKKKQKSDKIVNDIEDPF
jgi:hypothetical protein